ncbi:atos homolog protein A [Alosa pseudoharengus]|uniref:atos homolog protein A n=1 Tax=Alosa pseudoharengus TaxID=34774 RepID=UPI003F88641C
MKPDRDAGEEFFEHDAEEFLVFLTLLITEGRTPECSVKGRTEGLHCPPAQSAQPVTTKHECNDKLPQCRQARKTRSEVVLLWRNNIPIMIEVMLLPDCCYSDEGLATDGTDLNDPAIKQDALLLERWTLQPVPRQSGDRFIEEKTLLLAVRSYVFFSQLSAWLSASHGIVPRNILYRISAADEELVWNFSETPSEHAFPVPNVSHSVALKVRVQSLPRQPNYPVLKCSIHSGLPLFTKRGLDPTERLVRGGELGEALGPHLHPRLPGSPLFQRPLRPALPQSPLNSRKCPLPEAVPPNKTVKWFYSKLSSSPDTRPLDCYSPCANGTESPKAPGRESPVRAFKSLSLADPLVTPGPSPRPLSGETNPLIGSLLQERQEVIARIAQRLNFCDPTAPHLPDGLFSTSTPQVPKSMWSHAPEQETLFKKTKEPPCCLAQAPPQPPPPSQQSAAEERSRPSLFDTPVSPQSHSRLEPKPQNPASKPASCRRLLLSEPADGPTLSEAVQDISRLIQERLQQSHQLLHCTYKLCRQGALLKGQPEPSNGYCGPPAPTPAPNGAREHDCSRRPPSAACPKLEATPGWPEPPASDRLQNAKKEARSPSPRRESGLRPAGSVRPQSPVLRDITQRPSQRDSPLSPAFTDTPKMDLIHSLALRDTQSPAYTDAPHAHPLRESAYSPTARDGTYRPPSWDATQKDVRSTTDRDTTPPKGTESPPVSGKSDPLHDENQDPSNSTVCTATSLTHSAHSPDRSPPSDRILNGDARSPLRANPPASPLKPCNNWKKQNRHSIDGTATKAFHPCTGLPLLSSPVPQRKSQTGYFDLDTSLIRCKTQPWATSKRACLKREGDECEHLQQLLSASAPPASLSLLGNFEECVLNYRLEPLGTIEGFTAEVGASGTFCPSHMTFPVDVSFYSVSDDNAPSPYMGVINLESLGKRGYRVPPSGTIQVTLFNPNKTVVKMFVVMYDLREMPAGHQTFLRQRTFSVPVKRESNGHVNKKSLPLSQGRTLRYLVHLRFQSSKSGKIYLHRDIRLLFSRKSMEVDSGAAYELKSFTESPADPRFSPRC